MAQETKPGAFILLGAPGSGKSTQAEFFKQKFGAAHIDIGAALRNAASEPTPIGEMLKEIIYEKQTLVPDGIVRSVLEAEIGKTGADQMIVIDGAPRRESQIRDTVSAVVSSGKVFYGAIFIELSEEESVKRISCRFSCEGCGAKLILGKDIGSDVSPCPRCGGKVTQRADDTQEGVRTRWKIFHDETLPVLAHFARENKLFRVSGEKSAHEIFDDIRVKIFPMGKPSV